MFEEKGEPKRGIEPGSFGLQAERLTTRPNRLTVPIKPVGTSHSHFILKQTDSNQLVLCARFGQ